MLDKMIDSLNTFFHNDVSLTPSTVNYGIIFIWTFIIVFILAELVALLAVYAGKIDFSEFMFYNFLFALIVPLVAVIVTALSSVFGVVLKVVTVVVAIIGLKYGLFNLARYLGKLR